MRIFIGKYPKGAGDRKVKIEINSSDVYNAHSTLSLIIQPLLEKFREELHGAPYVDNEDVPEELKSDLSKEDYTSGIVDENHFKRWDYVLDEMIYSFKCDNDPNWEDQFWSGKSDLKWELLEGGKLYEMKHGPNHTLTRDEDAFKAAWKRRSNGLRLFGKYYHHLWD